MYITPISRLARVLFLLIVGIFASAPAQEMNTERSLVRLGIWGQAVRPMHTARFTGLASLSDITYENKILSLVSVPYAWSAGALAEFPLVEFGKGASLGLSARVGASSLIAEFATTGESFPVGRDGLPASISYRLSANVLMLSGEPLLTFRFAENRVALMAGAQFTMPFRETTVQRATIISAQPISDDIRRQYDASEQGSIGKSITPSLLVGASWEIPLTANGSLLIVPEVFYSLGLANVSNALATLPGEVPLWRMNTLRAGIALKFAPEKPLPPPSRPDEPLPTTPQPIASNTSTTAPPKAAPAPLSVKIATVIGIQKSGQGVEYPTIAIEEFAASSSRYLLPYIFFDEKSAAIPQRFTRLSPDETVYFKPENLISGTLKPENDLDAYAHILNIVGYRLHQYPNARLTLTGFNDAAAESAEKSFDGRPLGLRRAERIKEYLQTVWEIPSSRIITKSGGTRGLATPLDAEENRVVEMQASQPEIFGELRYDYTLRTLETPVLEVEPEITAPKGLAAWSFRITQPTKEETNRNATQRQTSTTLVEYDGKLAPRVISSNVERAMATVPLSDKPIAITVRAADSARNSSFATVQLPVKTLTLETKRRLNMPDVRVGTYWVFCFDLNSKQILVDDRIRRAVQAIKTHITPGASLEIKGYADTRGDVQSNRRLSDERAESVSQLIGAPSSRVISEGKGESTLYENTLPEGRFYNRFVRVDVRTPVVKGR